jgi:hypothetical protein|tara:strand:+ start:212 stop:487 length:276 start_codon:yes stop_codon:yes gene_type:complete
MSEKIKKSAPSELTKLLVLLSKKLSRKQYDKSVNIVSSLLTGVNYGYDAEGIDFKFHRDAYDIFLIHSNEKEPQAEVLPFKVLKGGKKNNV